MSDENAVDLPETLSEQEIAEPEVQAATDAEAEQPEVKQERTFTQAELDAKVEKRLAKERAKYERETAELRQIALSQRHQQQEAPRQQQAPAGPPKVDDFNDLDSYISARAAYEARNIVQSTLTEREQMALQREQERVQDEMASKARERMEAARTKYEDFDDVMSSDVSLSPAMVQIISNTSDGMDIAYFLAKNPQESERIARLDPYSAALEMGAIREKVRQPKKTSSAPTPLTPVTGASRSTAINDDLPIDEWMKRENARMRRK